MSTDSLEMLDVRCLDEILDPDCNFVNLNLLKIYYAYKECVTELENDIDLIYPNKCNDSKIDLSSIVEFILRCKDSGHTSPLEHATVTFIIRCARVDSHQIVRSRVGVAISQKSQRYTKSAGLCDYLEPKKVADLVLANEFIAELHNEYNEVMFKLYNGLIELGIPSEDARFYLNQGSQTSIQMTFNFAALFHFFEMRLCSRAQHGIRYLAEKMKKIMTTQYPLLFDDANPRCSYLGWCPEHKGCGRYPRKDQVMVIPKKEFESRIEEHVATVINEASKLYKKQLNDLEHQCALILNEIRSHDSAAKKE